MKEIFFFLNYQFSVINYQLFRDCFADRFLHLIDDARSAALKNAGHFAFTIYQNAYRNARHFGDEIGRAHV